MSDTTTRRSPLYRVIDAGVHAMMERAFLGHLTIRGDVHDAHFRTAVSNAVGIEPPRQPNTIATAGSRQLAWLGPDEWLLTTPPGEEDALCATLRAALAGQHAAVTDVSDGYTVIVLEGEYAADTLSRECPLDLHGRLFAVGTCAQTLIGKSNVLIVREDLKRFTICVRRSFAEYLYALLQHSAGLVLSARQHDG